MVRKMPKKNRPQDLLALVIDDEEAICTTVAGVLADEGWGCVTATSGLEGIEIFKKQPIDIVFLDVWMKRLDGIETLQRLNSIRRDIPIVVMSGHGTVETAVRATKLGAVDFLEKPLAIERILAMLELAVENRNRDSSDNWNYQLIGESEHIAAIHRQIKVVAPRNSWVLITGQNGTGKEVVARNIHLHSKRAGNRFVAVNCAAIPEDLIESELFGHAKGAFTSAVAEKIGKFELANRGTLFLDEIGDMSLKTQAKILRILQEQTFERLGSNELVMVDVRVIAATNKDLVEEIRAGRFREDLYYRLNVIPINMVPLRDRPVDIPCLTAHFAKKLALELGEEEKAFTESAIQALMDYHWPGNVRELKNIIERVYILCPETKVDRNILLKYLHNEQEPRVRVQNPASLRQARSEFEKTFILDKLESFDWNVSKTAEAIGVERSNLHRKLRTYDIDPKRLKHE